MTAQNKVQEIAGSFFVFGSACLSSCSGMNIQSLVQQRSKDRMFHPNQLPKFGELIPR